jgi:hypothetical protein
VLFYEGYLGLSPSTVNLSKAFAGAGYDVTVYATPTTTPSAGDMGDVAVRVLSPGGIARFLGDLGVGRLRLARIARRFFPFGQVAAFSGRVLLAELAERGRAAARTVYVGIDMDAVLGALVCATLFGRPFLFLSLELTLTPSQRRGPRAALIQLAYRRAAAALTQGVDRLAMMTRDFRWEHPKVFILPNSPYDSPPAQATDSGLFRRRFAIAPTQRIALQAGMIEDKSCCAALARGFSGLEGWALVLHERTKHSPEEPYMRHLRSINADNLHLSLEPVPYDEIDQVFASADVGLTFYEPSGPDDDDFRFISSSGKLPNYLKHGKPVLVSDLPPLVEIVREFDCGIVIKDPSDRAEIGAALRRIDERYDEFSRNARRCFTERFDFGKAVQPVIEFANTL